MKDRTIVALVSIVVIAALVALGHNGALVNLMGIITPATNIYQVSFSLTFPFRTSLRVYVENTALAGNNMTVDAIYAYELLA